MHKFIQVTEGENNHNFTVKAGSKLSIVFASVNVRSAAVTLGVRLVGPGASVAVTGIIIGSNSEKVSVRTIQIHEAPHTASDVLVKSVLSGHAECLYDGSIRVEKVARKTIAHQRNDNLLLSDNAYARSRPSLEILTDDVHCTHGAASGPVDTEQLWYLMSRGLSRHRAGELLVRGFIQSALDRVVETRTKRSIMSLWEIT